MARAPKATTLEYFKLVHRLENNKLYTLHDVVEAGREAGLFAKSRNIAKATARAVEALRVRARRNGLKVDRYVNDSKYIHRAYFGWRLKLTYKPSFFSEEEYETLIQHAVDHDGVRPSSEKQRIDRHDLTASTRIVAQIKKQALEETRTRALAQARAEVRRTHRIRLSLALLVAMISIAGGLALSTRAKTPWRAKARPISLFATDLTDINAVFELDHPMLVVGFRAFGLGDWLSITGREGYLVQIKRDEVVLETSYGLEAFRLPELTLFGTVEKDRKNVVIYPAPDNKRLLEAVFDFTGRPLDRLLAGSIGGTADFANYNHFIEAASERDHHIFYSSQIIWHLDLEEFVARFNQDFGLDIHMGPCVHRDKFTFIKPQLETLMEMKEKCHE